MAYGLQIYKPNGTIALDTNNRIPRIIGVINSSVTLPASGYIDGGSQTFTVAGVLNDGNTFTFFHGTGYLNNFCSFTTNIVNVLFEVQGVPYAVIPFKIIVLRI